MTTKNFKNWWFLALNGVVFAALGLLILLNSGEFLQTVIKYFGIVILVLGGILLVTGINQFRKDRQAGMILFESIAAIAIGFILVFFPGTSFRFFIILVGLWSLIIGIIQLATLPRVKVNIRLKRGLLINGILAALIGIIMIVKPMETGEVIFRLIGLLVLIFGVLLVYFSFLLRTLRLIDQAPEEIK
jgi:uncharacterized membrane protein HdeD (DUF308 family)